MSIVVNPSHSSTIALGLDWSRIAYLLLVSRTIDTLEENALLQEQKLSYQFSARGHDLAQIILGSLLTHQHDAASGYYRSRPLLLSLGLSIADAFASSLRRQGGLSDGRDIGVVFNLPNHSRPCVLPMSGGVGSQFTPTVGWAQAIVYRRDVLRDQSYEDCISVALGGDAAVASSGFWSALGIATTECLPMLFYIEDNGFGISVPAHKQIPGGNIAANLASFQNLLVLDGDGTEPSVALGLLTKAMRHVRSGDGPALVRLDVPRLCGHSAQDAQAYKPAALLESEWARDPLPKLKKFLVPDVFSEAVWQTIDSQVEQDVHASLAQALTRPDPEPSKVTTYVFCEQRKNGAWDIQTQGGLWAERHQFPESTECPEPASECVTMLTAIRRTLNYELSINPKVLIFGEDVGRKGGVHRVTMGLQDTYGASRVFDTSLSEEGIIGRAVGMALAGLLPIPEIQFRKYADPAEEQLNDCGTMRWRTANRFAAPMVVRMPVGFFTSGDPWHSQTNEVKWVHAVGWQVAMPANAEDAVGLLRAAMRSNNPTIFLEHRSLLEATWARRPYPGDRFLLPFGKARKIRSGEAITIVSWGAMVQRCEAAATLAQAEADILDLRTLMPWDKQSVLASVRKTHCCLIVHEDNMTAGFGAEIAAMLSEEAWFDLNAPLKRLAMPDIPSPHNPILMNHALPSVAHIATAIKDTMGIERRTSV